MNILLWIVLGLIAGYLANMIDPAPNSGGILGSILLGIAGAVVGGFLASRLFGVDVTGFNFQSVAVAVLGSLFLLFAGRAIRGT